jgi:hypothetical protein
VHALDPRCFDVICNEGREAFFGRAQGNAATAGTIPALRFSFRLGPGA